MITKHTAAVIIKTHFHLAYQQCILYNDNYAFNEWNINNEYINEKKEDDDHVNAIFSSFILGINNAIKDLDAISQSLHGPHPVFQTQQGDLYLQVIHYGTTKTHMFFQLIIDYKQHFDPGGPKF